MKTLDRYIGINFVRGFLLVVLILTSLFYFLELVAELNDVGHGAYRLADAFSYVTLMVPRQILDLLPVSSLLGSIIAMGLMADNHELIAMYACGVSMQRICWSVLGNGALLMVVAAIVAEFVAPPMEQHARRLRSQALSDPGVLRTETGFWARDGSSLIRVRRTLTGGVPAGIEIYERDEEGRLLSLIQAPRADIQDQDRWVLRDAEKKTIGKDGILSTQRVSNLSWPSSLLNARQIDVLGLPPDSLSPSELYLYVRTLRQRGENADHYALALWQKLSLPLTTGAMVLLSLPFVFGSPQRKSAGKRIMVGSVVGIGFHLASRIIGHVGLLLDLHPAVTTLTPVAAVLGLAVWLMGRVP